VIRQIAPPALDSSPDIAQTMLRRLATSMYVELRTIQCHFNRGVLTLTGLVPTFYLKQVLTSLAEGLEGVTRIENHVELVGFRARSEALLALQWKSPPSGIVRKS